MKRPILLFAISSLSLASIAQSWSGSTPGNIYYNQGSVGIGTSDIKSSLHVSNSSSASYLRLSYGGGTANGITTGIVFSKHWDQNEVAKIYTYTDNGSLYGGSELRFQTAPNSSTGLQDRLTIDENGNIGVGTSDVKSKFHVFNSSSASYLRLSYGGGTANGITTGIVFSKHWDQNEIAKIYTYTDNGSLYGGSELRFQTAPNSTTGLQDRLIIDENGNVGIGHTNPTQKLQVAGTVYSTEVKVELAAGTGPDYVFEPDYKLRTLKEIREYISENKHLPEIPSAKEMEANGVDLGDMNMRLLKKIEELTLYQIELMEEMEAMKKELQELKK